MNFIRFRFRVTEELKTSFILVNHLLGVFTVALFGGNSFHWVPILVSSNFLLEEYGPLIRFLGFQMSFHCYFCYYDNSTQISTLLSDGQSVNFCFDVATFVSKV